MAVKLGAAHIDERGKASGGAAGDQTGKEVCIRNYYVHSKGWRVFRPVGGGDGIALCMEAACANNNVGYNQDQRNTLYNAVKPLGFDVRRLTEKVETDCSALVRVCCAFAGILLPDFNTASEASVLLSSGKFVELTGDKYTKQDAYLKKGDILVTRTKGHTEVVLTDGGKVESGPVSASTTNSVRILKKGMIGSDVKSMQQDLIKAGYSVGADGADGEFGNNTLAAVKAFQKDSGLEVDGEYGPLSRAAMEKRLANMYITTHHVRIINGQCWVRSAPNTSGKQLGVVAEGTILPYGGIQSDNQWLLVEYKGQNGWVSGKYGDLID